MRVSTPEATAFDLARYARGAGQLANVATVLSELSEHLDGKRLVQVAKSEVELACLQRVGFLLDLVGAGDRTGPLATWMKSQRPPPVPLQRGQPAVDVPKSVRWQVSASAVTRLHRSVLHAIYHTSITP